MITPSCGGGAVPAATRIALIMLGLVELLAGLLALGGAIALSLDPAPGFAQLTLGVLAPLTLLALAVTGIFLRRPWSYLMHLVVVPIALIGAALFLTSLVGGKRGIPVILATGFSSGLMALFFLSPDVRKWFGMGGEGG